ncbi:MAG: DUF948 domain-containing protein [Actinophytocola sp.]|nr:DUF948 domain-containing protein [Actinophytocola sp.]
MSPGHIAALIAAGAFVVLVILLAIVLFKLGRTLDETTKSIIVARERSDPLLLGANTTITSVNKQLDHLDNVTANVHQVSSNASALSSVFTATLGGPLVKVAALSYGISKAIKARRQAQEIDGGKHARGRKRGRK